MKVIIADDQSLIREGLKVIIEQDSEIEVVALAENGRKACELCGTFLPDIVLMDIVMPVSDGLEGTRLIKEKYPEVKVLILTTSDDSENILKAMQSGADGYVLKNIESDELIGTVKSVASGLKVMDKTAFGVVLAMSRNSAAPRPSPLSRKPDYRLTDRELEIIRWIVFGKSNKEIAAALYISEGRVRNAISGILDKVSLKDRTQLAVFALRNNIV